MGIEEMLIDSVTKAVVANLKSHLVDEHKLMTEEETAELLGVSKATLGRMRNVGLKGYQPMGRSWYYFLDEVKDFVVRNG